MKGKGLWIAAAVVLAMSVACLIDGDFQAFGGAVLVAAILAVFAIRKGKRRKADVPVAATAPAPVPASAPLSRGPVQVGVDLDGSAVSFGPWDVSIHDAEGQDVRFDRALFQNIAILEYDAEKGLAHIAGSRGGTYETTLDGCTCEDFRRRGLPCKHIYKLALSRGYSADAFFSARSDVVWYADNCRVYHVSPDCRGLRNRIARRTTVAMAEYKGLRLCKTCADEID